MSQEFDNNALDLVKQKGFYPYEYMSDFEKFKEELCSKEKFVNVIDVWNKFKMKAIKYHRHLYLKCDVFY